MPRAGTGMSGSAAAAPSAARLFRESRRVMAIVRGKVYTAVVRGTQMTYRASAVLVLTAAVVLAVGFSVRAQRRGGRGRNRIPETSQMLQSLKRLKCTFP